MINCANCNTYLLVTTHKMWLICLWLLRLSSRIKCKGMKWKPGPCMLSLLLAIHLFYYYQVIQLLILILSWSYCVKNESSATEAHKYTWIWKALEKSTTFAMFVLAIIELNPVDCVDGLVYVKFDVNLGVCETWRDVLML